MKSTVALKETFAMTDEGRRAFRHEAQRLANLEHEVFPKVSDYFVEGEGAYLVMQLVHGEDLAERLKERINYHEGPFSPVKVLEWADQLLDALEMLHEYRPPIIHRDIKPSNLKLTRRGKIVLLDFGIAKGVAGLMSATDGSVWAASANFAPLEQVLRTDEASVDTLSTISQESVEKILHKGTDPRSDLYALAATLYCLMTGKLPADSRHRAMAMWAGGRDPLQPASKLNAQVPEAVSNILMHAMALDPSERIANAATMRQSLREAVGAPTYIPPTIPPPEELVLRRKDEARRGAEAETERQRLEEEARQRAEEETKRREAEAQREREEQVAARRAKEERQHREALERQRVEEEERQQAEEERRRAAEEQRRREEAQAEAEAGRLAEEERARIAEEARVEERARQEAEARRLDRVAEAERRQADEERRRAEQERLMREAEEAERKRAAELEEERTVEAQQSIASTQRASESTPSDSLAVKTIEAPPPERFVLTDGKSAPLVVGPVARNKRVMWIVVIALVALTVFVVFILVRYGGSNNDQSQSSNSSSGNTSSQTGQEANASASNSNSAAAPPPAQSLTPPAGMTYVPGGEFTMGRNDGDEYERPAHRVTVKPFFIDIYEVTNEDYAQFIKEKNWPPPPTWKGKTYPPPGSAHKPVTGVNWYDARAYADWAGKRLPTEEEWEFAARGTDGRRYPWDKGWRAGLANADHQSGAMADVGAYKGASPFGVFDMIGNAWEWTINDMRAYTGGKLPELPAEGTKVLRGGSYKSDKDQATATYRYGWRASGESSYAEAGFRCVKDVTAGS